MPGTLILLCGLCGSGKSTLAKKLEPERNAIRLSPDEWIEAVLENPADHVERDRLRDPIENLQWDFAQNCLVKGLTVILDNGFWSEEERTLYAIRALELGAKIELHFLDVPQEELLRRVLARNESMTNKAFVMTPEEVEHYATLFQAPDEEELIFYDEWSIIKHS